MGDKQTHLLFVVLYGVTMHVLYFLSAPSFMVDDDESAWRGALSTSKGTVVLACSQDWYLQMLCIFRHLQNAPV